MSANKKSDPIEKCGTMSLQIPTGSQGSYDAKFKLTVIREAEATNNCRAGPLCGGEKI